MLNNKDMATMIAKLQAPLVVADLLPYPEALTGDEEYALHEMISEMQPDSALLAIAASALKIANANRNFSPAFRFLSMECARIVEEYGPLWMRNAEDNLADDDAVFETLSRTPEDLRDLAEMIEMCNMMSAKAAPKAAALGHVLAVQARAQSIVAEAYVEAMEAQEIEPVAVHTMRDNVVTFPGRF